MNKIKIAYVILHYKNAEVTTKCLNYLISIMGDYSKAIVVDNYSQNNSLDEIKKMIGSNDKIHYICNSKNIGFARGNNLGYEYARETLNANCIIIMNNDIFIKDPEFEIKLYMDEIINKYSIIAPDVVTLSGKHQNPLRYKKNSTWKLFRGMILQYLYAMLFRMGVMIPSIVQKYHSGVDAVSKKVLDNIENIVPHGSCVIFAPNYVQKEKFAFIPETFFYGEEDLLYEYAEYRMYSIVYYPTIQVIHAEKQSTKSISRNELTVLRFRSINKAKSIQVCLKYRIFPEKFRRLFDKTSES